MRFYGKRLIRKSMQQVSASKQETRDGILWEVLPDERMCKVKIQGSIEYIHAYYPENWEKTPMWLKPGNAVKIMHSGGVRGKIEIIGHGQMIPTPVLGVQFPDMQIPIDSILTGCNLIECSTTRMAVLVKIGTYRIGGVEYTLTPITMQYGTNYQLDDGGSAGEIAGAVAINAAPSSGNYRYDLISVGINGVIDYTAGTPGVDPTPPALEEDPDHLQLVPYIFVPYGTTKICNGINIGGTFSEAIRTSIGMVIADNDLDWTLDPTSTTVTVTVYDQYGHTINGNGYGWYLTLEIVDGNGTVSSDEEGSSLIKIGGHTGTGSSYVFTYTRDLLNPGDESPTLQAKLSPENINTTSFIILRDVGGDPM